MNKILLLKVYYLPQELEPNIFYVSEEFGVAGHLCPCGCGNKIITPLNSTEWSFAESEGKPTLYPSIGNWQLPCRSHYWITDGIIEWSYQWTEKQITSGQKEEEKRRKAYYKTRGQLPKKQSILTRCVNWLLKKT